MLNIFAAPIFDDPEKTRKARIFKNYMLGIMAFTSFLEITLIIFFQTNNIRSASNIIVFNTFCILLILLNRKGFYKTASIIYIASTLIASLIAIWFSGGMDSLTIPTLTVIVLMGGLMLGWKAAIIIGLVSVSASLVIAVSDFNNILPANVIYYDPLLKWLMHSYIIGILIFIQHFTISDLNRALQNVREELSLRKKAEEELRSSEELRKRVFDSSWVPIVVMDTATYKFIDCNDAAVNIYKFSSREETLTKSPIDASAPCQYDGTDSASMIKYYIEQATARKNIIFEWLHQRPDGELWDGEVHLMSFKSGDRQLLQFTLQDITERKRTEKALLESERRYRFIAENTDDVIWSLDLSTGKYTYISPSVEKLRGYTPEEVMEQTLADTLTPESYQKALQLVKESLENREPGDFTPRINVTQFEQKHKDGSIVYTESSSTMFFDDRGQPSELIGVTRDITERKKAEEALRKSEERYRNIVEMTDEWIWEMDLNLEHTYSNKRINKILGYSLENFLETSIFSFMHPDEIHEEKTRLHQYIHEKKGWQGRILRWRHKNGGYRYLESTATPILNEDGEITGFRGADRDITERIESQEALRKSEERYKLVTELATDYIFILGIADDGKVTVDFLSDNYYTITGRSREDVATVDSWASFIHPDDIGGLIDSLHKLIAAPDTAELECRSYIRSNKMRWVNIIAKSQWDEQEKRVTSITGAVKNITDRKKAEEAIQQNEAKYRSLFESASDAIFLLKDTRCMDCNSATLKIFNCEKKDILGKTPDEFHAPVQPDGRESAQAARELISEAMNGTPLKFEWLHRRFDGTDFDSEVSLNKFLINDEPYLLAIVRDITERKKAEEALQQSETRYRTLFESSNDAIFLIKDGLTIDCNPAALKLFSAKRSAIINKSPYPYYPTFQPDGSNSIEKDLELTREVLNGATLNFEWRYRKHDGTDLDTEIILSKISVNDEPFILAIVRDITDRKKAEEQIKASLREKETLLRELYHRTKNNMQVISAMVNLSTNKLNDAEAVLIIKEIDSKIHTMSLVHKKLYESRDLSHINLKEYLEELSSYLASFYRSLAEGLTISVKGDDIFLLIDIAIPLGMVLNEMITNALKYAFPGKKNGCIEIQLTQNKGKDITITISDNGVGLPHGFSLAENASLGLNTVIAIIEQQLQGKLHFESNPDKGTTWIVTFKTDLYAKRV